MYRNLTRIVLSKDDLGVVRTSPGQTAAIPLYTPSREAK